MKITGKLYRVDPIQEFPTFKKRLIIVQNGKNFLPLILKDNDMSLIDAYVVGDDIEAEYDVWGRLWVNKDNKEVCFVDLSAKLVGNRSDNNAPQQAKSEPSVMPDSIVIPKDDFNSLPF
jgi:hypothetical protein